MIQENIEDQILKIMKAKALLLVKMGRFDKRKGWFTTEEQFTQNGAPGSSAVKGAKNYEQLYVNVGVLYSTGFRQF